MNNQRKKSIIIVILLGLTLILTVAYAALASNLSIAGTAKISGAYWDISFSKNLESGQDIATNTASIKSAELNNTTLTLSVELVKPLDSITHYFDVVNKGTIDAQISTINLPDMDALTAHHIFYELTYYTLTNQGLVLNSDMTVEQRNNVIKEIKQDVLAAGSLENNQITISPSGKRNMKVFIKYKDITNEQFTSNPIELDFTTNILYVQAENE